MMKWFPRLLWIEGALFAAYLVVGVGVADRLPKELTSWAETEAMKQPGRMLVILLIGLMISVCFPLGLFLLGRFRRSGRWALGVVALLYLSLSLANPVVLTDRWADICHQAVVVGYGVVAGLLWHPDIRAAFAPGAPSSQPKTSTLRWIVFGVGGLFAVGAVVVIAFGFLVMRIMPQPPSENLELPPAHAKATDAELEQAIAMMTEQVTKQPFNKGIAIGVTREGRRMVHVRGAGVTTNSLFEIGSVSKTFTGAVLARAVERGMVKLEDPVHERLGLKEPILCDGEPITLLDLGTHHSGLPRLPDDIGLLNQLRGRPYEGFTRSDVIAALKRASIGKREYDYSNFGMTVLAHCLSEAGKRPFAEMQRDLCEALGLTNTWIDLPLDQRMYLLTGHQWGIPAKHWFDSGAYIDGAGSTLSTIGDMLSWIELNMAAERPELKLATKPHRDRAHGGKKREIGLGWHREYDAKAGLIIEHNGATGGFCAYVGFAPEAATGVVVLLNSGDMAVPDLAEDLLRVLAQRK